MFSFQQEETEITNDVKDERSDNTQSHNNDISADDTSHNILKTQPQCPELDRPVQQTESDQISLSSSKSLENFVASRDLCYDHATLERIGHPIKDESLEDNGFKEELYCPHYGEDQKPINNSATASQVKEELYPLIDYDEKAELKQEDETLSVSQENSIEGKGLLQMYISFQWFL